jgi:hypothetical protein
MRVLVRSNEMHVYEIRARKDDRGVDLISDALPFGHLWYAGPNAVANAIGYAEHRSRSDRAVIRVYDESGNVIETYEHKGDFKEWCAKRNESPPHG